MRRYAGFFIIFYAAFWLMIFSSQSIAQTAEAPTASEQTSEPTPALTEEVSETAEVEVAPEPEQNLLSVPVTFREEEVFELYFRSEEERAATIKRAEQASQLLEKALHAEEPLSPGAPLCEVVEVGKNRLEARVRGFKILDLGRKDFLASRSTNWEQFRKQLQAEITSSVSDEMDRLKIQSGALKFFLSVLFALIGFIMLRQVHQGFNRAEQVLERRRESFKPIALLSETLISGQTVGGLWTISLVIGRMLAYLIVILTSVAAILGQFTFTRNLMTNFFSNVFSRIFESLETLVEAIPGLILSLALVLLLQLSLQVLSLFLKGVRSGRISWAFLSSSRVPVVNFWATSLLFVVFVPLIIASAFGNFQTPLGIIFLLVAAVLALSILPLLVNIAAGSLVIWQGKIVPGQWIKVKGYSGEVTEVSLNKITIVPEDGGRVFIPMTLMLFNPCFESKHTPQGEYRVRIVRTDALEASQQNVKDLFPKELEVDVICQSMSSKEYLFSIYAPKFQNEIRRRILTILSDAHDQGKIQLTETPIKEVDH